MKEERVVARLKGEQVSTYLELRSEFKATLVELKAFIKSKPAGSAEDN